MSSKITCDNPIYRFFLIKNWNFTSSGYCRLFIALNNQETINEFITLINESLDYKGASLNGLVDVIGSSSINSYVNSYSNNLFLSKNQIFGTCWANACAACIHFANMRVLGRKQISFEDLRKHIIINYSLEDKDGNNISNITKKIYDDYKITVKQVDENEAKIAVMKGRPCIASFYLSGKQWANFSEFFYDDINKYKYLDSNFINKDDYPKIYYDSPKSEGHVVVLIDNKNEGMTFLNSWGIGFGDFGKFRIKNGDVLTDGNNNDKIKFYDVYWTLNDLSYDEKKYYKENHEIVISNTLSFIMGSKQKIDELMNKNIICNKCNNYSKAINYKGNFLLVKCPLCNSIYENNNIDLKKCLYLREILPNEENYHLDNSELRNKIKEEIKIYCINSENTQKINDFKKSVNCIIILSDNRLCACSSDYSIKIYNYNKIDVNFQLEINKEKAHNKEIWCIEEIQLNILASGGFKDIKIWKIEKNNITIIISIDKAHNDYLNKIIKLDNQEFSSCSRDGTIKFWDNQYKEKYKINAHSSYINSILKLKSGKLVSGSNGDKKKNFLILNLFIILRIFKTKIEKYRN